NYKSQFNEHHFLLSKFKSGNVKTKFIGTHMKGKLPRHLWVPKVLVTHVKGPKLAWVPKPQKSFICVYVNYKAGGKHWVLNSGCTQHMTGERIDGPRGGG